MICIFTWPTKIWFVSNLIVSHLVDDIDIEGVSSVTIVILKGILFWTKSQHYYLVALKSEWDRHDNNYILLITVSDSFFILLLLYFCLFLFRFSFSNRFGKYEAPFSGSYCIHSFHTFAKNASKFYQIYYLLICLFTFHIYCGCNRLLLK
jgi:hypothetical protein